MTHTQNIKLLGILLVTSKSLVLSYITSSHHMEKTEAGLKGLCIREIMTKYTLYSVYNVVVVDFFL